MEGSLTALSLLKLYVMTSALPQSSLSSSSCMHLLLRGQIEIIGFLAVFVFRIITDFLRGTVVKICFVVSFYPRISWYCNRSKAKSFGFLDYETPIGPQREASFIWLLPILGQGIVDLTSCNLVSTNYILSRNIDILSASQNIWRSWA